jgi:hypothetical protein
VKGEGVAVLSDQDRAEVTQEFMAQAQGPHTITKADIRAAVNALDEWYNSNAASANAALPQPARGQMTTTDKAHLSNLIVNKRYVKGS